MRSSSCRVAHGVGLFAARVVLLVPDGRSRHDVPLCREVVLLKVDAHLDAVGAPSLVDVPKVNLRKEQCHSYN